MAAKTPSGPRAPRPKTAAPTKKRAAAGRVASAPVKLGATKRAPSRRAPSNVALTKAEQLIVSRMEELSADDPRYQVLEAALAFKASWVILGEHLTDVAEQRQFKIWGYGSFSRYCSEEVRITAGTARKLVKSYRWLGEEAPEFIPKVAEGRIQPARDVPDVNTIGVLADAKKAYEEDRVPEDAYLALKQAALEGDRTATELRRELKESIPENLRDKPTVDKVRSLRRALNSAVKVIDQLREWDGSEDLLVQAEELRDSIAQHLPRQGAVNDAGETTEENDDADMVVDA